MIMHRGRTNRMDAAAWTGALCLVLLAAGAFAQEPARHELRLKYAPGASSVFMDLSGMEVSFQKE